MNATRKLGTLILMITLIGALLSACGSKAEPSTTTAEAESGESTTSTQAQSEQSETKSYTDSLGHTVEIPVNAKRIIFTGSDLGDLLALDVKPVGAALGIIGDQIAYPELLDGIEDVGDLQGDLEKITSLSPDLILLDAGGSYYEENQYTLLSKIAPTVTYDRLSTNERVKVFGDILGKEQAAEEWIKTYAEQSEQVRNQLDLPTGVTASVFLQLGKDMYVMGNSALAETVYDTLQFTPAPKVKESLIDKNERFANISSELLPEYAGEYLFVLTDLSEEERNNSDSIMTTDIWKSIPAVKNNKVYYLNTKWNFDDPITKERLMDELPSILGK